jgi:hypothetical protein
LPDAYGNYTEANNEAINLPNSNTQQDSAERLITDKQNDFAQQQVQPATAGFYKELTYLTASLYAVVPEGWELVKSAAEAVHVSNIFRNLLKRGKPPNSSKDQSSLTTKDWVADIGQNSFDGSYSPYEPNAIAADRDATPTGKLFPLPVLIEDL